MMNNVSLIGRLTADPVMRFTNSGINVTNFYLAVERDFKAEDGTRETDFFNVVVWRNLAEYVAQYTKKGSMVGVSGKLQSRKYQTKEGESRTAVEVLADAVQFLDRKKSGENTGGESPPVDESDLPF